MQHVLDADLISLQLLLFSLIECPAQNLQICLAVDDSFNRHFITKADIGSWVVWLSLFKKQTPRPLGPITHCHMSPNPLPNIDALNGHIIQYRLVASVITGHCRLNKQMNTMGFNDSALCNKCGEVETAIHFLRVCLA